MFCENIPTKGFVEYEVNISDSFQVGSSEIITTQPRMPYYKLGVKYRWTDVIRKFLSSRHHGIYFKVLKEGRDWNK
jgi:MOSC domain-containing protein YiiM